MPLFEYRCPVCGENREVLVRTAAETAPPPCPSCGGAMERVWAPVASIHAGSTGCSAPPGGFR